MTEILEWIANFLFRMFQVPELKAILSAECFGLALAYLLTLPLPAWIPIRVAVQYSRVLIFLFVMAISVFLIPTPRMAIWAFTVAIFTPLFYEWTTAALYHRFPWLKPKSLLTDSEMENRIAAKAAKEGES